MKIGILGGTFDPVHKAHIEIANLAIERLKLDKVIFIPNRIPPHKEENFLSKEDKLNMLNLAIKNNSKFETDTFEIDRDSVSYLYITLEYLKEKYKNDELYFLAGADNIKTITTWKNPHLIFRYANIVFIKRPDYKLDKVLINKLSSNYGGKISVLDFEGINISSTVIRDRFENCIEVKHLLDNEVYSYIILNCIYPGKLLSKLKKMLKPERFEHSKNVAREAYKLATVYGENCEKAYYAGLLHDCAKNIDLDFQLKLISEFNEYEIMENELSYPKVIHALCGPIIAKKEFGVDDKEILDAIRYHTLGNINMSKFDKILYIADLISSERNYKGIEILREIAYNNIDKAIVMSIDNTLSYLQGKRIQPDVLRLRDYLKEKI